MCAPGSTVLGHEGALGTGLGGGQPVFMYHGGEGLRVCPSLPSPPGRAPSPQEGRTLTPAASKAGSPSCRPNTHILFLVWSPEELKMHQPGPRKTNRASLAFVHSPGRGCRVGWGLSACLPGSPWSSVWGSQSLTGVGTLRTTSQGKGGCPSSLRPLS